MDALGDVPQPEPGFAFISGAASGLGRATAAAFAAAGVPVLLCDREAGGLRATREGISRDGGVAELLCADVADAAGLEEGLDRFGDWAGPLRCAFNAAGVEGPLGRVEDVTPEEWASTIAINLTGVFNCMRLQLPRMRAAGGGSIVNCASVFGLVGSRGGSAYAASKHGVVGLTRSAALEHVRDRIRVNAVCPGLARTPMVDRLELASPRFRERALMASPGERLISPDQVAATVLWLCGDGAAAVSGQAIAVDDGFTAG